MIVDFEILGILIKDNKDICLLWFAVLEERPDRKYFISVSQSSTAVRFEDETRRCKGVQSNRDQPTRTSTVSIQC